MFRSDDPFLIHNPLEIEQWLRRILRQQPLMQLSDTAGTVGFLTTLLDIHADEQLLLFDAAQDEQLNARLTQADLLMLSTELDRIPLHIPVTGLQLARDQRGAFFYCTLPETIRRLQRRRSFRVHVPKVPPVICTVAHQQGPLELIVDNISVTGVALTTTDLALPIAPNQVLQDSVLALPQMGPLVVDLFVVRTQTLDNQQKRTKLLGCSFKHLNPRSERNLQNYIFTLQRLEAAKNSGSL